MLSDFQCNWFFLCQILCIIYDLLAIMYHPNQQLPNSVHLFTDINIINYVAMYANPILIKDSLKLFLAYCYMYCGLSIVCTFLHKRYIHTYLWNAVLGYFVFLVCWNFLPFLLHHHIYYFQELINKYWYPILKHHDDNIHI